MSHAQKTIVKEHFRRELDSDPGKKFNFTEIGRTYTVAQSTVQFWHNQVLLERMGPSQATLQQKAQAAARPPWGSAAPMQAAFAAASCAAIVPIPAFNPGAAAWRPPADSALAAFKAGTFCSQLSNARAIPVCARPNLSPPGSTCDAFRAAERLRGPLRLSPPTSADPLSALPRVCRAATQLFFRICLTFRYAPPSLILPSCYVARQSVPVSHGVPRPRCNCPPLPRPNRKSPPPSFALSVMSAELVSECL
jgi:hypothetical protein